MRREATSRTHACLVGLVGLLAASSAEAVTIEHRGVGCVVAGKFPIITARLDPAGEVARARVYFRATGTPHWYFVRMGPDRGRFSGVLPKPKKTLKTMDYYIEAVDLASAASRTADTRPEVAAPPGPCRAGLAMAPAVATAKVVVGAPGSAPAIPLGFAGEGVVSATSAAGPGATGGSGTAGAAGMASAAVAGVSTAAIVVGVVGAGAAVAAVAVASGGSDDTATTTPPLVDAAAGTYTLVQINGAALPVLTVPFRTPPSCTGFTDSGTLTLTGQPARYDVTLRAHFVCLMGPANPVTTSEGGTWSAPSSGTITFTPSGSLLNMASGTLRGTTLTVSLDAPSYSQGVAGIRVSTEWRKQ